MKTLKAIFSELALPFILCWFFMSVLVDIVAIPTVFKYTTNLIEAGKIGMTVFHRFNCFEIFFAVFIILGIFFQKETPKMHRSLLGLSCVLLGFALFYTFYMTPMIANTSIHIHELAQNDPMYEVLQRQHTTYHNLYRTFDTTKLLVLLMFAGIKIRLNLLHKERA
jgi:hypothetical protein